MLIIFLLLYILIFIFVIQKKINLIINPIFWLIISWFFIFSLYFFAGINYKYKITLIPFIYILSVFIIFILFYFISKNINLSISTSFSKNRSTSFNDINTKKYFIFALFGIMIWIFDIYRLNVIVFSKRIENFNISAIGALAIILVNLSLFVWLYELIKSIKNNKFIPLHAFLSVIIYIVPSILTAGRQNLLIFTASTTIGFLYSFKLNPKYKYRKYIYCFLLLVLAMLILYLLKIVNDRSGSTNKNALFEFMFNSKTSNTTKKIINNSGSIGSIILEVLYYYSHELSMFDIFFKNYDGPTLYGMFQLHYISRRLPDFLELDHNIPWIYIDGFSSNYNVYSHVWRTALSNFIIDFGKSGTIIFSSIIGSATGISHRNFMKNKSSYNLVLQILICIAMIFSIQYSPFNETGWAYTFYWMLIIPYIEKIKLPKFNFVFISKLKTYSFKYNTKQIMEDL